MIRTIVNMLTVLARIWTNTSTHAKLAVRDETGPLVVLQVRAKRVTVDEATNWIAIPGCAIRSEFLSLVERTNGNKHTGTMRIQFYPFETR